MFWTFYLFFFTSFFLFLWGGSLVFSFCFFVFHTHSFFHFFTSFWSSNYSFIHHTTIISHIQLYLDGGVKRGGMYFGPSFLRSLKLFSNPIGPTFLFLLVRTCDGCIGCTSFSALPKNFGPTVVYLVLGTTPIDRLTIGRTG